MSQAPGPENLRMSLEWLRRELDNLLETARSGGERALESMGVLGAGRSWTPSADISEFGDEIRVSVDLPGVSAEAVDVLLVGNMLTVKGERRMASTPGEQIYQRERSSGTFSRSIPLPVPVEADSVSAEVRNGVLQIRLSKAERAKTRSIKVRSADAVSPVACEPVIAPQDLL